MLLRADPRTLAAARDSGRALRLMPLAVLALVALAAPALAQPAPAGAPKRIRGKVIQVQDDVATIDQGREAGVTERSVYDVFEDGRAVKLPLTSEVVYVPQRVTAQLVIVDVEAKTAQAKIVPPPGSDVAPRIAVGALVFTNPYTAARNLPPYVKSITADPPRTDFGRPVTIRVQWGDDKDDLVAFDWTTTSGGRETVPGASGTLSHARSAVPQVVWTPPVVQQKQTFKIMVTAFDTGGGRTSKSVDIESGPVPANLKNVYGVRRPALADHTQAFKLCRDLAFDDENSAFIIDDDAQQIVGLDAGWNPSLKTEEREQPFKELDRIVIRGADAYMTDLSARRAVRLRIGTKMYQDPPAMVYGGEGSGNGTFEAPTDIAVDARGDVFVLDGPRGCVQIFTNDGQFSGSIGSKGQGSGQLGNPAAIALSHEGTLFVLDNGRKRCLVYQDRRLTHEFEVGAQADQLADLKVDPTTGRICVLETTTGEIRSFNRSGSPAGKSFGQRGEALAMGTFYKPTRLKFDRLGSLYVIASEKKVLHRCDAAKGEEVARWGGIDFSGAADIAASATGDLAVLLPSLYIAANLDRLGWVKGICGGEGNTVGKLSRPVAVAVDVRGYVAVLDQRQGNVQMFTARGEPVGSIGKKGDGPTELEKPLDMTIDPTRRWLAVLDDRDEYEVKVFDAQGKAGEELKAAFPGDGNALDDVLQLGMTASGTVNVVQSGGKVESFKVPLEKGVTVDPRGANSLRVAGWALGLKNPTSVCVSNLGLQFAAYDTQVQVRDLVRQGAIVTTIEGPDIAKKPAFVAVDDFDRVYLWDAKTTRVVELGR